MDWIIEIYRNVFATTCRPILKQLTKRPSLKEQISLTLLQSFLKKVCGNGKYQKGEWTILRVGHTPTRMKNRHAPEGDHDLEVDKMSKKALDAYWELGI